MISFKTSKEEAGMIREIADRASAMAMEEGVRYAASDAAMDVTATHANGCPLKLRDLLCAPPFDFAHDVFGIRRNINRETGELDNCFVPRLAR